MNGQHSLAFNIENSLVQYKYKPKAVIVLWRNPKLKAFQISQFIARSLDNVSSAINGTNVHTCKRRVPIPSRPAASHTRPEYMAPIRFTN